MNNLPRELDVAIVGGGPAGLATALSLAQHAPEMLERVAVLERAVFPRDKFCAGGLAARADTLLQSMGVHIDVPSVPVAGMSVRLPSGSMSVRAHQSIGRVVRRVEFDDALARAARDRGVRIAEGVRVSHLEEQADGYAVHTSVGCVRARVVVGADGVGSIVRRSMGLSAPQLRAQVVEVDTEPVAGDLPRDLLHFESMNPALTGYTWDFPTLVEGRELVCRGAYVLHSSASPVDASQVLHDHLRQRGLDLKHYRSKRYAERAYVPRTPFGQRGAMLVGEAAGVDPITGEGIPQALAYGELAGRYLAQRMTRRDVSFGDWTMEVQRGFFARDLAVRHRIVPMFYGPHRAWLERLLVERPLFLRAGLELFAGRRVPRLWVMRVVLRALGLWLRSRLTR